MDEMAISDRPLRLFLFCNSLAGGKGGAERVATEVASEMIERGHTVHLGYQNWGPPAYDPHPKAILEPYDKLPDLRARLEEADPDVFLVLYFNRRLLQFTRIAQQLGVPYVIQECTNPDRLCASNWSRGSLGLAAARWEREIAASAAARIRLTMPGYAMSFASYIRPQIRSFANPAFPQEHVADPSGDGAEHKRLLVINGFKANKNFGVVVSAFARVAADHPEWRLRVVGKDPDPTHPYTIEIFRLMDSLDIRDRIDIAGPTDDIMGEFRAAHLHLISSLSEGCPTVVLEAMSMGLPSIGFSDCPGTNELIQHEKNGLLAGPENRDETLAACFDTLMGSREKRVAWGAQALADSADFDPVRIYDQWERLFHEAAAYKTDADRLHREQSAVDPELAAHAARARAAMFGPGKVTR